MNEPAPNDPELDALLGAYVLDALESHERLRVEAYLARNARARDEVDELRESAASLALAPVEDTTAPPGLWNRISRAIDSETVPDVAGGGDELAERRARRAGRGVIWMSFVAAAAAISAVVLAAQVVSLHSRLDSRAGRRARRRGGVHPGRACRGARKVSLVVTGGAEVARVVLLPDGSGYLQSDGLARLASDRTYQLWALTGSAGHPVAISAGVLGAHPQAAAFRTVLDVRGLRAHDRARRGRRAVDADALRQRHPVVARLLVIGPARARATMGCVPQCRPSLGSDSSPGVDARFGVYVHIPFCASRCDYCDFATWTDRDHLIERYVHACVADLARRREAGQPRATSVFFGGGTPSLIPAEDLARILGAIERADGAEVTVECNPDTVDAAKLATYAAAGVNRLSIGVQSMVPHVLAALGRTHDPVNVVRAVELARAAGFSRLNVDLIYGTPGESPDDWQRSLDGALALGVDHVSAYALTVEPATALGRRVAAGAPAPDDDLQADAYVQADAVLSAAGLEWYEVSNWAAPGEECRHNELYWSGDEYVGIGCAAHGHTAGTRWWNVRTPERYIAAIEARTSPVGGSETLDRATRAEESFALALRRRAGVVADARAAVLVADLAAQGFLERAGGDRGGERIALTRRGRLLASDLTARLLLAGAAGPGPAGAAGQPAPLALGTIEC